jgi:hypothetical protein
MNVLINLRVAQHVCQFFTSWGTGNFSRTTQIPGISFLTVTKGPNNTVSLSRVNGSKQVHLGRRPQFCHDCYTVSKGIQTIVINGQ